MIDDIIRRKPGEKVVFFLRRHPIVFIVDILLKLFLAMIPVAAWFTLLHAWPTIVEHPVMRPVIILTASAYYLMLWLFFLVNFADYYLDAWIVTDDRILNVEQHGLFSRTVSELDLSMIQDVTSEVHGIAAFIFGYGDVYIQTAAERERFRFEQVRHPELIRKSMLQLVEADRKKQGGGIPN